MKLGEIYYHIIYF